MAMAEQPLVELPLYIDSSSESEIEVSGSGSGSESEDDTAWPGAVSGLDKAKGTVISRKRSFQRTSVTKTTQSKG